MIEDEEAVRRLEIGPDTKLAYLTQTTLSVDDANQIISKLREKFPHIQSPPKDDICYATQNRQEAVKKLSEDVDAVIILGSQNSSNSQRLRELGAEDGTPAYLVDGPEDLDAKAFTADQTVLISAGAGAPESVVQATIRWLESNFEGIVEEQSVREESVRFPLPKPLRSIQREL